MVPSGKLMTQDDWDHDFGRAIMVYFNGSAISETDQFGQPIKDDSFILIFNAHDGDIEFTLPGRELGGKWKLMVDTADSGGYPAEDTFIEAGGTLTCQDRTTMVLKQVEPPQFDED